MHCLLCVEADALPGSAEGADVLLLAGLPRDRAALTALRVGPAPPRLYIRLDPNAPDLAAALALAPDGVLLPGVESGLDLGRLASRLAVQEAEAGLPDGATCILAGLGSARALLQAASLVAASPRLSGILLDEDALARDLAPAAPSMRIVRHARTTVVLAAAAARVPALAPVCADPARVMVTALAARREGFSGMMARSAEEAAAIASVFRSAAEGEGQLR